MLDRIWVTKNGQAIPVSKMETKHIVNSIAKIERDNWRKSYLPRLYLELDIRKLKGGL